MKHVITDIDKSTIIQGRLNTYSRIYVLNKDNQIVDVLTDFTLGGIGIDGDSNMRRSFSVTINKDSNIVQYINTNLQYDFKLQIGIFSFEQNEIIWYECGQFVLINADTNFDNANNSLQFGFGDQFAQLDGTRNGQNGGAPTIIIPNKDSNDNDVIIRDALINFITTEGINKYIVEDLGEFYGIPENNPTGYEDYRRNNPLWNKLPYDLEFSAGCMNADIINEIIGLYPNQQVYFDIYGNFCANMIPSCTHSPVEVENSYLQNVLVADSSEGVNYDIQTIKNVTEVFGKVYDVDRYTEEGCVTNGNTYNLTLDNFDEYLAFEYIAFMPDTTNAESMYFSVNSLNPLPIYKEYTTEYVEENAIKKDEMCVLRIMKDYNGNFVAYYLGAYQPHALCVLTDNILDKKYTREYFINKYNCKNVILREEPGSPFTVQKLGEVLDVKSGDEFDNILSDTVASENAIYYNQRSSSMNETITITTLLLPWLDVHSKVSYKKAQDSEVCEYVIKSINHDVTGGTSSITMYRFYPLYFEAYDAIRGTYGILSGYTHEELNKYTHKQLQTLRRKL